MTDTESFPPSYELLLYAVSDTRFGVENRWFTAGSHRSRNAARLAFLELSEEFTSARVILLLVASMHDPATGRFRDVIIEARGIAPLIDRKRLQHLTRDDRLRSPRRPCRPAPGHPRRRRRSRPRAWAYGWPPAAGRWLPPWWRPSCGVEGRIRSPPVRVRRGAARRARSPPPA